MQAPRKFVDDRGNGESPGIQSKSHSAIARLGQWVHLAESNQVENAAAPVFGSAVAEGGTSWVRTKGIKQARRGAYL